MRGGLLARRREVGDVRTRTEELLHSRSRDRCEKAARTLGERVVAYVRGAATTARDSTQGRGVSQSRLCGGVF